MSSPSRSWSSLPATRAGSDNQPLLQERAAGCAQGSPERTCTTHQCQGSSYGCDSSSDPKDLHLILELSYTHCIPDNCAPDSGRFLCKPCGVCRASLSARRCPKDTLEAALNNSSPWGAFQQVYHTKKSQCFTCFSLCFFTLEDHKSLLLLRGSDSGITLCTVDRAG